MLIESIKMSWDNIMHNKLRSFLTMLGIVIGVASIIALITIVQGATNSISKQINDMGVNKITITAMGTPLKQGLTNEDMENISAIDNVDAISPTISGQSSIESEGNVMKDISIEGKNEVYFNKDDSLLKYGRSINIMDLKSKNHVAVVGSTIVNELFYGVNPIGKNITMGGITYSIIGTLSPSNEFTMQSNNDTVIIPYTTALRSLGVRNISSMDVYLDNTDFADQTVSDIKGVLEPAFNYKEDAYTVFNMGDMIDTFESMMSMMSTMLGGIAAISLIVGGIGIMNMMLVSISERTSEIGLRKALGATPNRIQLQFIIEAIFLSIIGGIIGLILGSLIAYIAAVLIGTEFTLSLSTILLAAGFSGGVGIIFGYMPARKASKLNPIDALRSL